ncbi:MULTISPECIES: hypothetical protein [Pseudomonas]|uniref:hypothetical protein n=1 Tax=Pseudomonas guariconensis TaxID=1288410 RepID=UPI002096D360|nr:MULTISPECIES: hypothetical protein [Pseudomonas]MCO7594245.1 hypothetical protein [Pseudomonas guariconensis]MCU7220028.1 hypothetical protein [Pseudomonas brassicacearum]
MNNTNQMVRVPCELLEQALDAALATGMQDVADELNRILTPSAKKDKQVEPVAYALFTENGKIRIWSRNREDVGIENLRKEGQEVVPLYTRPDHSTLNQAALDILAERQRQIVTEGYTPQRDDQYTSGQLADAASTYSFWARTWNLPHAQCTHAPTMWPWPPEMWKPKSQRQMLIKAGGLILAELERLDRQTAREVQP